MRFFQYEIRVETYGGLDTGTIEAVDLADAKRLLRVKYLQAVLPPGTVIAETGDPQKQDADQKSDRLRGILVVLSSHHRWQRGEDDGRRADLSGLDLRGLKLGKVDLSDADLSGIDLTGADLCGATLRNAKLSEAILAGARLDGADLRMADLTDADLRMASLIDTRLEKADLWRANLLGATISPKALHAALGCCLPKKPGRAAVRKKPAKKAPKKALRKSRKA